MEETLMQYGFVGLALVVVGKLFYDQYKQLIQKNNELEEKVDHLQKQMLDFMESDRVVLLKAIDDNSKALASLQQVIKDILNK